MNVAYTDTKKLLHQHSYESLEKHSLNKSKTRSIINYEDQNR